MPRHRNWKFMIASSFSCKERPRPALGLESGRRGPVAPFAGMSAHCSSASAIRCLARFLARFLAQCGRTFVVAQDVLCRARRACTFERSCAPAFNLAENSVTSGGDGPRLLHPLPERRERVQAREVTGRSPSARRHRLLQCQFVDHQCLDDDRALGNEPWLKTCLADEISEQFQIGVRRQQHI